MGFEKNGAALLLKMRAEGTQFGRVLTVGRQNIHMDWDDYRQVLARIGCPFSNDVPEYADALFLSMGACSTEAMDYSGYEGATRVHDLNYPIPPEWHEKFDTVFDGGSLEHVFNFPVAIANCMQLLAKGGSYVSVTMANNWCGHGFYQFSPELFFRVLSPPNGFSVVEMYIATIKGAVFKVKDPEAVRGRIELCNREPVFLLVHARRDSIVNVLQRFPQQSDYVQLWGTNSSGKINHRFRKLKRYYAFRLVAKIRRRILAHLALRSLSLNNRNFYTPATLSIWDSRS